MARRDSETDDRDTVTADKGTGVTPLMILLGLVSVLFVVFLAQNTDTVPVQFLWLDGEPPLFVVLLVTMTATALVTLGVAGIWRRRRRRHLIEREELDRLRKNR